MKDTTENLRRNLAYVLPSLPAADVAVIIEALGDELQDRAICDADPLRLAARIVRGRYYRPLVVLEVVGDELRPLGVTH